MKLKLNERIRALRRASGRTQEELAEILGVSPQAVSRWESAAGYPDTETLPRLANCFGVSLDELFGYEGDRDRRVAALAEKGEYRYSAPLLSRAVPKTDRFPESGLLAENLPACWPMWCNPDYEKVRREIEADPRWSEWGRKCAEQRER